jgi:branched-chain amino acid transport system permease protein
MVRFVVSLVGGMSLGGIYSLVALGIVLAYRATGTFNFAHGQFMLFPAFLVGAWQGSHTAPLWVAILVGLLAVSALGALFYLLVLQRTTGLAHFMGVIATLGLAAVMDGALLLMFENGQYQLTFPGLPTGATTILGARIASNSLVLTAFTLALSGGVAAALRFTSLGRQIRAAGQDPVLASQGGINVRMLHLGSWAIAGLLAGVAGIAYGTNHLVDPSLVHLALAAFPAILIGGLDSIPGSILGGLAVGIFQGFIATYYSPALLDVTTYSLLLLVMLVLPQGLLGTRHVTRV